jgi:hypothetical protein
MIISIISMEDIIDLLGQRPADTRNLTQILNTGPCNFLYSPELFQELLAAPGTDTGNPLQR